MEMRTHLKEFSFQERPSKKKILSRKEDTKSGKNIA